MSKRKTGKRSRKIDPILPAVVSVLVAIYFVYYFNFRSQAAPATSVSVLSSTSNAATAVTKEKYVAGEVIVKLKQPIDEFSRRTFTGAGQRGSTLAYVGLNRNNLPSAVTNTHRKYGVKSISRVFPQAGAPDAEIKRIKQRFNEDFTSKSKSFDEAKVRGNDLSRIYKINIDSNASVADVVRDLQADPNVEFAEPNYEITSNLVPNDPYFGTTSAAVNQWGLNNPGNRKGYVKGADIEALEAWNITRGSTSLVIAVIDSGIDYKHPDLGAGLGTGYKVVSGYDFVNNDADPMDDNGHGTHIAGIIAAKENNSMGVVGVCPKCKLMAVKVTNSTGRGNILRSAEGIYWAVAHGAKIINISWGTLINSTTLKAAIDAAEINGVVVVAAAGNSNSSIKYYPAAFPNVVGVASTDPGDKKLGTSNYDDGTKWIDVSAPGAEIFSTALPGTGGLCKSGNTTRYAYCSGTSMATPFVVGVLGLYESIHPVKSQAEAVALRNRISSATYSDNINAVNPLYVNKLGAGRLNAFKFLTIGNSWCADTDWGQNYGTYGAHYGSQSGYCGDAKSYDSCVHSNTIVINETHCSSDTTKCYVSAYKCPKGCRNGVCL